MENTVYLLFIVFLLLMNAYDRHASKKREDKLVRAVIAKNLGELALAEIEAETTPKDKLKQMKAENQLALDNQAQINQDRKDMRIPVT